jgi:hypothetical protein
MGGTCGIVAALVLEVTARAPNKATPRTIVVNLVAVFTLASPFVGVVRPGGVIGLELMVVIIIKSGRRIVRATLLCIWIPDRASCHHPLIWVKVTCTPSSCVTGFIRIFSRAAVSYVSAAPVGIQP